jgi:uncharacterized protein YbaR (Trm112 family)
VITEEFLEMLRCPASQQRLNRADAALVASMNGEIAAGRLRNRAGLSIARPVDELLVCDDGRFAYPVIDDIPILLADEAVDLTSVSPVRPRVEP